MRVNVSLVLAGLLVATSASAQTYRPERPYRGLFASGVQDPQQTLTVSASAGGGWDNNVAADALFGSETQTSDLNSDVKGGVFDASGGINYGLSTKAFSMDASGSTAAHYYPSLGSQWLRRYYASVNSAAKLTTDITVNGSLDYSPYSLSSLFPYVTTTNPGQAVLPNLDLTSSLEQYFTYGGGAIYQHHLSSRATISADYSAQLRDRTTFSNRYVRHRAGGVYTYTISRGVALRAGYHYDDIDYGSADRQFRNHELDAGIDYNRTLSFSRRTSLSFHTGTTAVSSGGTTTAGYTFTLTGGASLSREIGRTWTALVGYDRGVNVEPTWGNLVRSDWGTASLSGLLTRRLSLSSSARASIGNVGSDDSGDNGFESYYGDASLGYAVGRHISLGVSYAYYRHRFDSGVLIPLDFSNTFNRHSVRVFVSLWAPIVQRARRANATR
jgi:hypothetical protein